MSAQTEVILFDLGNIVIEFNGIAKLQSEYFSDITIKEVERKWVDCPINYKHETGQITTEEYAIEFLKAWKLPLTPEAFLQKFEAWCSLPFEGMPELIEKLSQDYKIACLSNTSDIHWQKIAHTYKLGDYFEDKFLSYEMGAMKPEAIIYDQVVEKLAIAPAKVVFFDDLIDNVEAAKRLGINAHQVKGYEQVRNKCLELNLI